MGFFLRAGSAKREQQLVARPSCVYKKPGARAAWAVPFQETRSAKRERQLAAALLASTKSRDAGSLGCPFPRDQGREAGAAACRRPSCVCKKLGRGRLGLSLSKRPGARSGSGSLPPPFLRLQKAGARAAWAVPFRETRSAKWERQLAAGACERMRECVVRFTKLKNKNMGSIPNRKCQNVFLPVFFMKKETI